MSAAPDRATLHAMIEALPDHLLDAARSALAEVQPVDELTASEEAAIRRGLSAAAEGREREAAGAFAMLRTAHFSSVR
jgi:hypothetical protein